MRLISFNPLRSLGIPGVRYIKPEEIPRYHKDIRDADWLLFPEYWQVDALVYGLKNRIFPSISTYHLGHDKVQMTRALWAVCPENVPHTRILSSDEANSERVLAEFDFPFVAKEVRNSAGKGVFLIESRAGWLAYARANPVLYVQEYLPMGQDLRVVVIGRRVAAAYWRKGQEGRFHTNVARGGLISFEDVPEEALSLVERIAQRLEINHAGFDVAEVHGSFYILEFNPFFGCSGLHQQQVSPGRLILEYLNEESRRLSQSPLAGCSIAQ